MKVSIIIPTYNRPITLKEMIASYICQKFVEEIIVIDDNSLLDYKEFVEYTQKLCDKKNIQFIYKKNTENLGAAGSRNVGLDLASGTHILWGEDDAFLGENYIENLFKEMHEYDIMCGSIYYGIYPNMNETEMNQQIVMQQEINKPIFNYKNFEGYYRKIVDTPQIVPYGHALILVPKEAYSGIRYYTNYKINGYREESDAQVLMTKIGYSVKYTSNAVCFHLPANKIQKGGQHMNSKFRQELYTIINNNKFFDRHYDFFKERYKIKTKKSLLKLIFIKDRSIRNISFIFKKVKRCLKFN